MTESEWLASADPAAMLVHIQGKMSDRKLRLFATGCCRQAWGLLTDERSRRAVEAAERYADGEATEEELERAHEGAQAVWHTADNPAGLARYASHKDAAMGATRLASQEWLNLPPPALQAALLREVCGNPFRPVRVRRSWLTYDVQVLANGAYDMRCWETLPIIADALEEAGCAEEAILRHLRGEEFVDGRTWATQPLRGPHVRGCWALDLLLGKE